MLPVSGAYAAFQVPDYRRFLAMRMLTTLSIQMMSVAVGYFVYDLTGDPLALGLIGLAEAVPAIGVSLYAGHLADRYNRRNILIICVFVLTVCALALVALAHSRAVLPTATVLTGIYGVIFLTGIARGFLSPTNFSFLPQLVDRKTLPNAIAWNSSTWEVASVTGLGLGGLLYGFVGVGFTFGVMSVLLMMAIWALLRIAPRPAPAYDPEETAIRSIRTGLNFVFSNRLIVGAIALDLFAVLFGGAVALLPVYAKDILHVGPEGLGGLRAAMSLGAIVMTFVIAHRPLGRGAGTLMLWAVAGFGLCIIGFGLSTHFWLSFALLFVAGLCDEVSVYVRASLIQHLTPDRLKGRVASVNSVFITSSNEIGAFESGLAASIMGTVPAVVFGGLMTLLVVAVTAWRLPVLRDLDIRTLMDPDAHTHQ